MDNKSYQENYRRSKEKKGWKYFSIMVPYDCHLELKKFYLRWKSNNLKLWEKDEK
jgi:hypothetical protein